MNYTERFSDEQIDKQCKYLWGITKDLLHKREENYELLDSRIQSVINIIAGSNPVFHQSPKVMSICANLEKARHNDEQFRKCILDSLGLIDELRADFTLEVHSNV
jgi:hypothetical protein